MLFSAAVGSLYVCEEEIGIGVFGKVYKVRRVDSGQVFALKEIDESVCTARQVSLQGELEVYPQLQSRYIVNCTNVHRDKEAGHSYLEMEYCNGGTLEEFIMQHRRRKEQIPESRIWELLSKIASGLAYLHSQIKTGALSVVVHRDVKPANILFADDEVKLADFGFCRPLDRLTQAEMRGIQRVVGTPAYLAPEIIKEQVYSQKVDIWALGCILLELCTLEIPAAITEIPLEVYLNGIIGYSKELKLVIKRCLEKIPYARISSADLLLVPMVQSALQQAELNRYKVLHNIVSTPFIQSPQSPHSPHSQYSRQLHMQKGDGYVHTTVLMNAASNGDVECLRASLHEVRMRTHDGRTALMVAALAGHVECMDILLEFEAQMYDNSRLTALMLAAKKNMLSAGVKLIAKECKLQDSKGMTALMHAAASGSAQAVRALISVEAGIRDKAGMTALMYAAKSNHMECATLLVPHEKQSHDLLSCTALMHAAISGSRDCVSLLLDLEGGMIDKYGETALMWAVRSNQLAVIPLLVQREACMSNVEGITALVMAVKLNHMECLNLLEMEAGLHTHSGETALLVSILADNTSCMQRLALMTDEINARIEMGLTVLMWCILNGKNRYIKWLLPGSLRLLDNQERTALMHSARIGDINSATLLAEHEHGLQDESGNTALMYAAEQGHESIVNLLLPYEYKMVNKQLRTALMLGMDKEQYRCCELLARYEQGFVDADGRTALSRAVMSGDSSLVRLCLNETRHMTRNGKTGLILAIENGFFKIAEILGPYEAVCRDSDGNTALHWAVKNNKARYIQYLTSAEGLLNSHGKTALKIALDLDRKDIFKMLLKGEAAVKMPDGLTILDCAALENKPRYIQYITTHIMTEHVFIPMKPRTATAFAAKETSLYQAAEANDMAKAKAHINLIGSVHNGWSSLKIAAYYGHEDLVKLLLGEIGLQVDDGFTALMAAAQQGHLSCVQLLLGEIGFKTKGGRTALMVAAHEGHLGVVSLLREFEGKMTDLNGNTALHCAAACGHIEVIKQLRQEIQMVNQFGETALMFAADGGHIKCLQFLRAEAGVMDENGSTALLRALRGGHMGCVTILLASEQTQSCITPLMLAAASGDTETAKVYISDASKQDVLGQTALMYAARHGHSSCVRILMRYEQGIIDMQGYTALAHAVQARQIECVELLTREACIPTGTGESVEKLAKSQGSLRIARLIRKRANK